MTLVQTADADFAWLLGGGEPSRSGLRLAPGGLDDDIAVIRHVRHIAATLRDVREFATWMMVADGEVVGLCGFHEKPTAAGVVELGYNVAPSRRGRGYASAAVAQMIEHARRDARIKVIVANTARDNVASQRVLERNGFRKSPAGTGAAEVRYSIEI